MIHSHTTKPPAYYTEATLVKKLRNLGIGRPSTYGSVIQTQLAPIGFQMALARSNGINDPGPALGGEQSDNKNGVITGSASFNPTTIDVNKISINITDWSVVHTGKGVEIVKGPWNVDIPIK